MEKIIFQVLFLFTLPRLAELLVHIMYSALGIKSLQMLFVVLLCTWLQRKHILPEPPRWNMSEVYHVPKETSAFFLIVSSINKDFGPMCLKWVIIIVTECCCETDYNKMITIAFSARSENKICSRLNRKSETKLQLLANPGFLILHAFCI